MQNGESQRMDRFKQLSTSVFQAAMRPLAIHVYEQTFPGCKIVDLRSNGPGAHVLDQYYGIDTVIKLPCGAPITVQEKYRDFSALKYGDFTQEYKNAARTVNEANGEWFKLTAMLYFYGWAAENQAGFAKWIMLDVLKYKLLVAQAGGLERISKLQFNDRHGKASFYPIKLTFLEPAIIADDHRPLVICPDEWRKTGVSIPPNPHPGTGFKGAVLWLDKA